jgi:hypothetical protein
MAGKKKDDLTESDLQGFKFFKRISRLLERLHDAGCARDRAHNRKLFMDQYMTLLLLYMFSPLCSSLQAIHQASTLKKVQRVLGVRPSSMGSLSEAARVFDSQLLVKVIQELVLQLKPMPHDSRLDDVGAIITAVDGTLLPALSRVTWALWQREHNAVKVHLHYEVLKGVPVAAQLTEGKGDEREALARSLEPGRVYVDDRGYADYGLMQKIIDAGSHFVGRIRDNADFTVVEERELSQEALDAGIVRDAVVWLGCPQSGKKLIQPVRIVEVQCTPHQKTHKNGRGGPEQGETLLIATDMLDLPADVVALIYKHRWSVETFFNTFKHVLGCRHLLSDCANGIEMQVYAAILACLLIALYTGRKPTLRTYEMLNWYFMGWADEEEMLAHIEKLKKQA